MSQKITNSQFKVTSGDSLSVIVSAYNRANGTKYSVGEIAGFNHILDPGKIRVGALINFPTDATAATKGSGIWKGERPEKMDISRSFAELNIILTHKEEWSPIETEIAVSIDGVRYRQTIKLFCWLAESGGGYKLYWSLDEKSKKPGPRDPFVTFQDGSDFARIYLTVQGDWARPIIKLEKK